MSESFKVLFFLKKGRPTQEPTLQVYVRVTSNGQRSEWSVQQRCLPGKWNQQTGRMTGTKEETRQFNAFLNTIEANIFEVQREFALRNQALTAEQVRLKVLHQDDEQRHTLIEVYKHHNEQFQQLVGTEYSLGSFKKFKTALTSIEKFHQEV